MRGVSRAAASVALWPLAAAAEPSPVGSYSYHMGGPGWDGLIFGPLLMIVILVAAVASAVLVLRSMGALPPLRRTSPLHALEERFARGEIDAAEFAERKRMLNS
jgi:putative membrane protein